MLLCNSFTEFDLGFVHTVLKMESWQISYINNNLEKLIAHTYFTEEFKEYLCDTEIWNLEEQNTLKSLDVEHHLREHFRLLYRALLKKKAGGYEALTRAYYFTKQKMAAKIMLDGLVEHNIENPFTFCKIPISYDLIFKTCMDVNRKKLLLESFTKNVRSADLKDYFPDARFEKEYYEVFLKRSKPFILVKNTISSVPSTYVERFISNKKVLYPGIFHQMCPDIFVFNNVKENILPALIISHIRSSDTQIQNITTKFIRLEGPRHWNNLVSETKHPIHLISYNDSANVFVLDITHGDSEVLERFSSKHMDYCRNDNAFFINILSRINEYSKICLLISDVPGMGKSLFLKHLATKLSDRSDRIVSFISFLKLKFIQETSIKSITSDVALGVLIDYVSPSKLAQQLFRELVNRSAVTWDLFFDDIDSTNLNTQLCIHFLCVLSKAFRNINIYVSSRLPLKSDLECALSTTAYEMLALSTHSQREFVVSYWKNRLLESRPEQLKEFENRLFEHIKKHLDTKYQRLLHLPKFAERLAQVFLTDAYTHSKLSRYTLRDKTINLSKLVQVFTKQIQKYENADQDYFKRLKFNIPNVLGDGTGFLHPIVIGLHENSNQTISCSEDSEVLGSGSGGTNVFKGTYGKPAREVAVKVIVNAKHVNETMKEIDVLVKCSHPNIVTYFTHEVKPNRVLVAMELCQANLEEWLSITNELKNRIKSREIMQQIAKGLNYLHQHKPQIIVHCDLKPSNILFSVLETEILVKLADFGISRYIDQERRRGTVSRVFGSPEWMAPEIIQFAINSSTTAQAENKITMTPETDMFSLGCVFFYILTDGHHPFGCDFIKRTKNSIKGAHVIAEHIENLAVSTNKPILESMLSIKPEVRPTSTAILHHPIVWSNGKKLQFLVTVSNLIEDIKVPIWIEQNEIDIYQSLKIKCIQTLESHSEYYGIHTESKIGWFSKIEDLEIKNYLTKDKYTKKLNQSVVGLVRMIRNYNNHFENKTDLPSVLGKTPKEFMICWLKVFPLLIHHLRYSFASLGMKSVLKNYYGDFHGIS